jgi:hypothetical protein
MLNPAFICQKRGEEMEQESCLFCTCRSVQGLRIFSFFICRECEVKLMNTSPDDERYHDYVQKVKKIWPGSEAEFSSQ